MSYYSKNAVTFGRRSTLSGQARVLPKFLSSIRSLSCLSNYRRGNGVQCFIVCARSGIEIGNICKIEPQMRNFSSTISLVYDETGKSLTTAADATATKRMRQFDATARRILLDDTVRGSQDGTTVTADVNQGLLSRADRKPTNASKPVEDQLGSPSDSQVIYDRTKTVAPRQRTTKRRSNLSSNPLTDEESITIATGESDTDLSKVLLSTSTTREHDKIIEQLHNDIQEGSERQSKAVENRSPRRPSRYDNDDFQLDRSILLTRPEKWLSTRRSQTKPSNFPDLPDFSRRMQNNPYVAILASKSRLCANWRVKLPSNLLQELTVFKLFKDASGALSAAYESVVSDRKDGDIDYVYLPLEPESKKDIVGGATYHILKREHVRQSNWKHLNYIRSIAGVPSEKTGRAPDMASLIERRLRRRLEISAKNLRLSGVRGFYIDENKANKEGIVIAELSWSSLTDAKGNLKDSEFFYNENHNIPVIRYFVNQLCGFETSSVVRECLTDIVRKTDGIGDISSWPRSIFVVENATTRYFLMHLWRLRLYIGDRVD
ncbi:uncharacterized protein V1513DRAFT_445979 [Lipomyces chichibuensis]|uniref:uncharacterized protein n=1 Tax=Lipomyces chichibuensis TaxID=1546026 RepID=UPI00334324DC